MPDFSLTELQLEIMNILWDREEATIVEVREALQPERDLAHTTVSTLLSRLEKKGAVTHRTEGRQYVYAPAVKAQRVKRSVVSEFSDVAERLFSGDIAELVTHLLAENEVDADDLARVRKMIEAKEAELGQEEENN